MQISPRISWYLDTRHASTRHNNKHHLKLRVTFKTGKRYLQLYYATDQYYTTNKEAERIIKNPRPTELYQQEQLIYLYNRAAKIVQQIVNLTPEIFHQLFTNASALNSLSDYIRLHINEYKKENRIGTAESYTQALASFEKYNGGELSFNTITDTWLHGYERYMRNQNRSITTISIYLRALRHFLNKATAANLINKEAYAFGRHGYQIKTERKLKLPLTLDEIQRLKTYQATTPSQQAALDFWLFSYYCNGMNMADVLTLTRAHLQRDFLIYNRAKTNLTKNTTRAIYIPLRPEVTAIILRYGQPDLSPNAYIFPVLTGLTSAAARKTRVKTFVRNINRRLRQVAKELGIPKLTTGLARHTFANQLLNGGVSKEFIQYALGHNNMATTEHYVGSFALDKIKKVSELL